MKFIVFGNPVPYLRMTQGQARLIRIPDHKISKRGLTIKNRIKRYFDYKQLVRLSAMKANALPTARPAKKVFMDLVIYFRNGTHGDPDNIFKAIADAIFLDDRNVCGSMDFFFCESPRVEVEIRET